MNVSLDHRVDRSPREALIDECWLCFGTAAGCGVFGLIGVSYFHWSGQSTPLMALLAVGGFYAVMGCGRLGRYFVAQLMAPSGGGNAAKRDAEPDHVHRR